MAYKSISLSQNEFIPFWKKAKLQNRNLDKGHQCLQKAIDTPYNHIDTCILPQVKIVIEILDKIALCHFHPNYIVLYLHSKIN